MLLISHCPTLLAKQGKSLENRMEMQIINYLRDLNSNSRIDMQAEIGLEIVVCSARGIFKVQKNSVIGREIFIFRKDVDSNVLLNAKRSIYVEI